MVARRSKPFAPRGSTLLEGLIASAVLLFGLVGAMNGIIVASRQNAFANRMQRASAIAEQTRRGLEARGAIRLLAADGLLVPGNCSTDADLLERAGEIASAPGACVIDFDAYEAALVGAGQAPIVAEYPDDNRDLYRRIVVYLPMDAGTDRQVDFMSVVVSWSELGRPKQFRSSLALHDPRRNQLSVEL